MVVSTCSVTPKRTSNSIFRKSNKLNLQVVQLSVIYFFIANREVVECEEFLTLSQQQVSKLICSDRLTVPSEEKVF